MAHAPRRGRRPTLTRNVAPGVHRLEHAYVNCYLIEDGSSVTIVDAGFPSTWAPLLLALDEIGRSRRDVDALVLTHAHFDHIGFAARAQAELRVPIWVHQADEHLAAHPYHYQRERTPFIYPLLYPAAIPVLAGMTAAGALAVKGVENVHHLPETGTLDVPGQPQVVFSPGHTFGHTALFLPNRGALLSGDALVTLDPYKGSRGAQIIAGAATADSVMALDTLTALADTDAGIVLPGHGDPWSGGIRAAVDAAREFGAS
ncbi:glyoxylase-like metal-dependent hydrolase (beta-lactamase superfamily II) [Okibacterium sp. HSC-33S16]|uniref:MBL fold metallo-hydrolase n=1 Tax=Okibacterium sp. HSC-33S16 TaxID=2910965 RepID=UPI00209F5B05|nr:MBL fold metallo-hydrolase [Okibacterium sp. HSC-33S16]MCP2032715.1 glyoxylase-like metal-dependent hydrolase (beta-lactamase superfamily II) [Okibacterium sp. HSC-33S16]